MTLPTSAYELKKLSELSRVNYVTLWRIREGLTTTPRESTVRKIEHAMSDKSWNC